LLNAIPKRWALWHSPAPKISFSVNGCVRRDKIFCYGTRRFITPACKRLPIFRIIFLPSCLAGRCATIRMANYWQVTGGYVRRYSRTALALVSLTEWSSTAWTDGELPRTVFWDDFTGHIYFTLGLGSASSNGIPTAAMRRIAMMSPFPQAGAFNLISIMPINGKFWAAADYEATLVNLVSMRLERSDRPDPVPPTAVPRILAALTRNSRIPP
jgi:hypothetical protein